ncbi:MAG: transcriptional repressor NrdR [Ruminococcaceae bacterium]|nr:transcriptional repressor NrdR [Oscillospiraceae bacterium]
MKCPVCSSPESKVLDTRPVEENNSIRRRRECLDCHARFTTYEIVDVLNPIVVKKDGSRELFDKNKLLNGLLKACQKRNVDAKAVADEIEAAIQSSMKSEITSQKIGEMAMDKLRQLDAVAYVRFASVHREFKDIDTFAREISELTLSESKE